MTNQYNQNYLKLGDMKISVALVSSFVVLAIQYFVLIYFNLLGTTNAATVQLISKVMVAVIFLYAMPTVINRSGIKFFILYFTGFFIFLINFAIFPVNEVYLKELVFPFFFMCLPAFIYTQCLVEWQILMKALKVSGIIIFIICTFLSVFIFTGRVSVGQYSMSLAYYMLIPAVVYLDAFFNNISFKSMFVSLSSILVILSFGSRGAVLCIIVYIVLRLVRFDFKGSYTRAFFYLLVGTFAIFTFVSLNQILLYLYTTLLKFGIDSRSIELFMREDVHLSGRDYIFNSIISELSRSPLLGIGLGGDRRVIGEYAYAHNVILEIISNFGVVIGSLIILLIIALLISSLLVKDVNRYNVVVIWVCIGFVHLMISSSYLTDVKFWILLGLVISLLRNDSFLNKKNNKIQERESL